MLNVINYVLNCICRFGFVEFDSVESAKDAFNSMKGQEVDGRQVFLDFAEERSGMAYTHFIISNFEFFKGKSFFIVTQRKKSNVWYM